MNSKTAWYLFETTGNIEAYLLYHDLSSAGSHATASISPTVSFHPKRGQVSKKSDKTMTHGPQYMH
ncbi:MAG TPA: hypothetical protein DEP42_05665 [Ruminococcaceae bacterium]|nr:hypothetical protein [Oscillospiraceae bacterium]